MTGSATTTLACFYDRQGKYPLAIAAYKQALQITPDNAEVYSNLGGAYIDQGGREDVSRLQRIL